MTLRESVVEAMAQAEYEADYPATTRPTWEDLAGYVKAKYLRKAERVLDAALDVLGEWEFAYLFGAARLLEELRAGKGSE